MNPPKTATAETMVTGGTEELISGSEAIAHACRLADVDVITAYPIRPYDTVMQYVSQMISNGDFDCEFIVAESEHSQFEIVKHASAVAARVFVGSSGVGWFYAVGALAVPAGPRHPVVATGGGGLRPRVIRGGGEGIAMNVDTRNPLNLWQNARLLARLIEDLQIDIVHARSRAPAWSAYLATQRTGAPFITTYHGP